MCIMLGLSKSRAYFKTECPITVPTLLVGWKVAVTSWKRMLRFPTWNPKGQEFYQIVQHFWNSRRILPALGAITFSESEFPNYLDPHGRFPTAAGKAFCSKGLIFYSSRNAFSAAVGNQPLTAVDKANEEGLVFLARSSVTLPLPGVFCSTARSWNSQTRWLSRFQS